MKKEEWIKQYALENGADVCGIGAIERFESFPQGFAPTDIWNKCKSVIAFGIALPKGLFDVEARLIYAHYNELICTVMDELLLKTAKKLEETYNCHAVPMPADGPYEYWDAERMHGKGLVSMKHAAAACGLGEIGKSTLLLNETYGNRLVLGILLTDLELESDPLVTGICIKGCTKCIDNCPVHAITEEGVNQKACRTNTYGTNARGFGTVDCNRCRAMCPRNGH